MITSTNITASYGPNGETIWPDGTVSYPAGMYSVPQTLASLGDQGAAVNAARGWDGSPTPGTGLNNTKPLALGGSGGATFGGSSSGGSVPQQSTSTGTNPYLTQMGDALVQQNTQNFNRSVMPAISSQALASGGFGGSRQGVIEANAMNDLNQTNANALANLYGSQWNNDRNRDLGYYQAGNSYNLGLGNLGLGYAGLDRQINNDNQAWQQQGINNGLNIWDRLQAGNNTAINAGNNIQNTPLNYWNQFSQGINSIGRGYGTSTGSSSTSGNPLLGAVGGAQLGGQLGSQVSNWWGS